MRLSSDFSTKIIAVCLIIFFICNKIFASLEYHDNGFVYPSNVALADKKILLLYTGTGIKGGSRTYKINLYKHLLKDGYAAIFFVVNNEDVQKELEDLKLPCYTCRISIEDEALYWQKLYNCLLQICSQDRVAIIMANKQEEVSVAKKIQQLLPTKIVATLHVDNVHKSNFLCGVDGVLAVAPHIARLVEHENKKRKLGIKVIDWAPPPFDAEKFLTYKPNGEKQEFFLTNFNVKIIDNVPAICMIGNFLNAQWKDHKTLLEAVYKLVYEKKQPVQLLLVGDGPHINEVKQYVHQLGLDSVVVFLGYTSKVPDVLYYSDLSVLISKHEAFGIVLLEAALMKKPLIGVKKTGMENVIKDKKTGLLINPGSVEQLVSSLYYLLSNEVERVRMGNNAYFFVINNFMPDCGVKKIESFLNKI